MLLQEKSFQATIFVFAVLGWIATGLWVRHLYRRMQTEGPSGTIAPVKLQRAWSPCRAKQILETWDEAGQLDRALRAFQIDDRFALAYSVNYLFASAAVGCGLCWFVGLPAERALLVVQAFCVLAIVSGLCDGAENALQKKLILDWQNGNHEIFVVETLTVFGLSSVKLLALIFPIPVFCLVFGVWTGLFGWLW